MTGEPRTENAQQEGTRIVGGVEFGGQRGTLRDLVTRVQTLRQNPNVPPAELMRNPDCNLLSQVMLGVAQEQLRYLQRSRMGTHITQEAAEDIAGDTLLHLTQVLGRFSQERVGERPFNDTFRKWIATTARNYAISYIRQQIREEKVGELYHLQQEQQQSHGASRISPEQLHSVGEVMNLLFIELQRRKSDGTSRYENLLTMLQSVGISVQTPQDVLQLFSFSGKQDIQFANLAEIANNTGMTLASVKMAIFRFRGTADKILGEVLDAHRIKDIADMDEFSGLDSEKINHLISSGTIPSFQFLGHLRYVSLQAVRDYLKQHPLETVDRRLIELSYVSITSQATSNELRLLKLTYPDQFKKVGTELFLSRTAFDAWRQQHPDPLAAITPDTIGPLAQILPMGQYEQVRQRLKDYRSINGTLPPGITMSPNGRSFLSSRSALIQAGLLPE